MIYTIILNPKFRKILKALVFVMIIAFSASLYSCQTYYTETYTPEKLEKLKAEEDITILEVTTTKDSTFNYSDFPFKIRHNYKDSSILLIEKVTERKFTLNLNDIKNIKIERAEYSPGKTILLGLGISVAAVLIAVMIAFSGDRGFFGH